VRIRTLGHFTVEVDGKPLKFGVKAQKKPLAMLKLLVAMGGDGVRIESLADILWPDSDGDQAYSAFTSTLARLRKLIGRDALIVSDGRLSLANASCSVDATVLAALLDEVESAVRAGDPAVARSRAESALALYRGPFIDGEVEPSQILAAREKLRGLLLRRLHQLGEFLASRGEFAQAIQLYQSGLESQPDAEELYRHLMRCLQQAGRLEEALAHYLRCREMLKSSLGAEPSAETERLHLELLSQSAQERSHAASDAGQPDMEKPSIAVLPFEALVSDPDQMYFADGIVEDIITELSKFRWFDVIARNTTLTYRGHTIDPRRIGEELAVRYILTGSVRKHDSQARITTHLVEARTGGEIWSERYDAGVHELTAVQDDIVGRVVGAINPELYSAEVRRARARPQESREVWNHAVRGRWHFTRLTPEDNAEAQRLLEKALELKPDHALVMAFLAYCHISGVFFGWSAAPMQSLEKARALAREAQRLDEDDAWVQCAMGLTEFVSKRLDEAVAFFRRAIELNPNFALAHGYSGLALAHCGESEAAFAEARKALRLSPRDPELIHFYMGLAMGHFVSGDYEAAARWADEAIRVRPEAPAGHRVLAPSLAYLGRMEEARDAIGALLRLRPSMTAAAVKATIHFKRPEDRDRYIDGLLKAGLPPG